MKKQLLLLIMMLLPMMASIEAIAHDIEVANADGITIYYDIFNNTELGVTFKGDDYHNYSDRYKGNIIIPETVEYNGNTYRVTTIGTCAFMYCYNLTSAIIPSSVTKIDDSAFAKCHEITSITIPNSVTYIGDAAFNECWNMVSINIPNGVTYIGRSAFSECDRLTSITIPNSVSYIGDDAFWRTPWLNNQPNGIVYAGKVVCCYKGNMPDNTILELEEGTLGIMSYAFSGCTGLTSITIPNSVTFIGVGAFSGTTWYNNQPDGLIYAGKFVYNYKGNMPENTHLEIEDGTIGIVESSFINCSNLTSVSIPSSVTTIGRYAFQGCSGLTSVTIPGSVEYIDTYTFQGCSGLSFVKILNGVKKFGYGAFSGCSSLASVTIPNSMTSIGKYAFNECSSLASFNIPNSVNYIGEGAFYVCRSLTSITIPTSLTSIKDYTFGYCGINNINIPKFVTKIGKGAFRNCNSLTSVEIPNSVTSIEKEAFYECGNLSSITIPSSVIFIGDNAFYKCSSLNLLNITELEGWCKIDLSNLQSHPLNCSGSSRKISLCGIELANVTIPQGISTIKDNTFYNCSNITSVIMHNNVTSIGEAAFYGCNKLESFILSDGLSIIKKQSFNNCSSLKAVTIPANVEVIYQEAFNGCNNLDYVKVLSENPPFLYDNSFSNYNIPLYVPEEAIDTYQTTSPWSNFAQIGKLDGTFVEKEQCAKPTIAYENGELFFSCETEDVTYSYKVTTPTSLDSEGNNVKLSTKYIITVTAKKDGYLDSEPATAEIDVRGMNGDANGDGVVDIADAVKIVNIVVGKE